MRELKFRAWHPGEKKMRYGVGTDGYGGIVLDTEYMGLKPLKGEAILMQYTELKDKNGKEIYEGDIVRGFCTGNYPAVIECDAPDGGYNIRERDGEYMEIDSNTRIEVIGNIHENPELLKEGERR